MKYQRKCSLILFFEFTIVKMYLFLYKQHFQILNLTIHFLFRVNSICENIRSIFISYNFTIILHYWTLNSILHFFSREKK